MNMASNFTAGNNLPPLPTYVLQPLPPLVYPIPDKYLALILPIVAYWGFSMIFHYVDEKDWFPQYRLHTPTEVLNRNHVSRWEVLRDVIIQQVVQTIVGAALTAFDPDPTTGMEDYHIASWAQRIRLAQRALPSTLGLLGLDAIGLSQKVSTNAPSLATVLRGGQYPNLAIETSSGPIPTFASWELQAASFLYWYAVPVLQFLCAIIIVDTWQYFLHRAMHMNKWLYTTFHSRHHRLYVPYAYGALYNHPFEGFLLDTCGALIAYLVTGMTVRQSMWFFSCSTMKTVDDHCGYAFPWDPLQHLTSNNAGYHDVHHQSWGIKTNFSQPFFTFWDRVLGTKWTGGDVSARYERSRLAAEKRAAQSSQVKPITSSKVSDSTDVTSNKPYPSRHSSSETLGAQPIPPPGKASAQAADSRRQTAFESKDGAGGHSVLVEETAEEEREREALNCLPAAMRPSSSKKDYTSSTSQSGALKGLRERVSGKHSRKGSLL